MYLLRIHNTATMIPIVSPIMTSSDTTTPATTPPVLLLLAFDGIEAVGILDQEGVAVTGQVTSIELVL